MSRPSTSKPRGVCRFYTTPSGCRAGVNCKFLHGAEEALTPYDKSKICKFFLAGYCIRGSACWFRHVPPDSAQSSSQPEEDGDAECCSICYEKPTTYGLLTGCSHVFCIKCIRGWRDRTGKGEEVVLSGNIKKCPMCRQGSKFITPSSIFYAEGTPEKTRVIDNYKASMSRVPCKHFEKFSRTFCPFGRDCFYQHSNADGTAHLLPYGVDDNPRRRGTLPRNDFLDSINWPFRLGIGPDMLPTLPQPSRPVEPLFEDPMQDLRATIEHIHASLPHHAAANGEDVGPHDDVVTGMPTEEVQALADRLFATLHRVTEMQRAAPGSAPTAPRPAPRVAEVIADDASDSSMPDLATVSDGESEADEVSEDEGPPPLEVIPTSGYRPTAALARMQSDATLSGLNWSAVPHEASGRRSRFATALPRRTSSQDGSATGVATRLAISWTLVPSEDNPGSTIRTGTTHVHGAPEASHVRTIVNGTSDDDPSLSPSDTLVLRESAQAVADADALGEQAAAILRNSPEEAVPMPAAPSHTAESDDALSMPNEVADADGPVITDEHMDDAWEAKQNANPPFRTDGRGKVVFASAASENVELDNHAEIRNRRNVRS